MEGCRLAGAILRLPKIPPPPPGWKAKPLLASLPPSDFCLFSSTIGPLHDPVTWYGKNYTGTEVTQWDFQNKGTRTSSARLSFVLKVPLCNLRPSVIYSVPYDRIVQRVYSLVAIYTPESVFTQVKGFGQHRKS